VGLGVGLCVISGGRGDKVGLVVGLCVIPGGRGDKVGLGVRTMDGVIEEVTLGRLVSPGRRGDMVGDGVGLKVAETSIKRAGLRRSIQGAVVGSPLGVFQNWLEG